MGIVSILQDEKFLEVFCTIVYTTVHLMVKMIISETCFFTIRTEHLIREASPMA